MSFMDDFLLSCAGADGFYPVSIPHSCRFDSARSCYLTRTPTVAGNRQKFTWSGWVKRCALTTSGVNQLLMNAVTDSNNYTSFYFTTSDAIMISDITGGTITTNINSTAVFRDPSNWMHVLLAVDTTQATATDRVKIYINGVQLPLTFNYTPAQNQNLTINTTAPQKIGYYASNYMLDAYLADVYFIDGSAITPTSFGQFAVGNPNVWIPKKVTGLTYGTNGFHLDFGNASSLGTDTSGQGNNWTTSGFTTTDQMLDTPTNNFPVYNSAYPVNNSYIPVRSNGNLAVNNGNYNLCTFMLPKSGKWYWEATEIAWATANWSVGICKQDLTTVYQHTESSNANVGSVYGCTFDADNGIFTIYRDNTQIYQQTGINTNLDWCIHTLGVSGDKCLLNFGANGSWGKTCPAGFKALCSANLPEPSIVDSTKYHGISLWTGNGTSQNITTQNFQPDLAWIKERTQAQHHVLFDSIRGAAKVLRSSSTSSETTDSTELSAFLTNGFSVGTHAEVNNNGDLFVGWCWKKDAKAGFDIVSYTGNGVNRTVAHSLGVVPEMIIVKNRSTASTDWPVYHKSLTSAAYAIYLDKTDAQASLATMWNSTAPTSSVFSLGTNTFVNENTKSLIAYLFASIPGFSMIGSYIGNGNADGPFIYCGFRPKYVLIKNITSGSTNWWVFDNARNAFNASIYSLVPNVSDKEYSNNLIIDTLSNGFKVRLAQLQANENGSTIIFAAFAEAPFKYSNAR